METSTNPANGTTLMGEKLDSSPCKQNSSTGKTLTLPPSQVGNDSILNRTPFAYDNIPEWQPQCTFLTGDMKEHQSDGNCLFYALYEASGYDEFLGTGRDSNIGVRDLRKHVVMALAQKLGAACSGLSGKKHSIEGAYESCRTSTAPNMGENVKIFQQSGAQEVTLGGIQNFNAKNNILNKIANYLVGEKIKNVGDITYRHLLHMLIQLGAAEGDPICERAKILAESKGDEKPFVNNQNAGDPLRILCEKILGISSAEAWHEQGPIDHNLLLHAAQEVLAKIFLGSSESVRDATLKNPQIIKEICEKYNDGLLHDDARIIMLNPNGEPSPEVKKLIGAALEIVEVTRNNSYMEVHFLKEIAAILNRDILVANADGIELDERRGEVFQIPGKVCSFTLYGKDGNQKSYRISDQGKILDPLTGVAPEFPEGTMVIAKGPSHFYGPPSFKTNGLFVKRIKSEENPELIDLSVGL